jgi:hypothetical protein
VEQTLAYFFGEDRMTKGRPWDIEEERKLRDLVEEGRSVIDISRIMLKTREAIRQKLFYMDLKVLKEQQQSISGKKPCFCSSKLELPAALPTVEETLEILGSALLKGSESGLDKDEIQRLQVVATLAKTYKELFADYLDYRGLEERLVELEGKYNALVTKSETHALT